MAQAAPGLCGGYAELLLGGLHDAGTFILDSGLDAGLVFQTFRSTSARNFLISSSSPASLASTALRRALASAVASRAVSRLDPESGCACGRFGQDARDGNADQQNDDDEVEDLEDAGSGFGLQIEGPGGPLDDGAFETEDLVLLFLGLGGVGLGAVRSGRCGCGGAGTRRLLGSEAVEPARLRLSAQPKTGAPKQEAKTPWEKRGCKKPFEQSFLQREPPAAAGSTARTTWPARSPAEPRMVCLAAAASASSLARACVTLIPAALRAASSRGVALGVPLLYALLAELVVLGAGLAQFGGILGRARFSFGDGLLRIFHGAFGQGAAPLQRGRQRTLHQKLVGQDQHDKQQSRRDGADEHGSELLQNHLHSDNEFRCGCQVRFYRMKHNFCIRGSPPSQRGGAI